VARPRRPPAQIGWTALPALACALGVAGAAPAAEAVQVSLAPAMTVPFTSDELARAIAMRLDGQRLGGRTLLVSLAPAGVDGHIRIEVGDRQREVGVADRGGREAVRVVALLVLDLVDSEPAGVASEVRAAAERPVAAASSAPASSPWRASLAPLTAPAASWDETRFEVDAGLERRLGAHWRLAATVGYGRASRTAFGASEVFQTVPVRAGVGVGGGWGDVRAQATLRTHWGGGATAALFGGWAEARPQLVHTSVGSLSAVLALELFGERLQFHAAKEGNVLATDYVTPWLGIAWSSP
jgi:hypothetical protein